MRSSAAAGADGAYEIANVPARSYPSVLFRAPGYDRQIAPVTVAANATAARRRVAVAQLGVARRRVVGAR